jgi:simple sugar transport system permease protein
MLEDLFSPEFGYAIFRVSTPLIFPALGVVISAIAGTINIGLEGIMLVSAFAGVMISHYTGSLLLSVIGGMAVGVLFAGLLAYFHLRLKASVILAAIALNFLASGLTIFLLIVLIGARNTSTLTTLVVPEVTIPGVDAIPVLGPIVSGHNLLTYGAFVAVFLYFIIVYRTPLGLRIRAVGQNPDAARSVGIDVDRTKLFALLLSGFFGALGGIYLSMGYVSWFSRDMTAGRGFIAVAAATLGGNMPLGTLAGSLVFGAINALAIFFSTSEIPSELVQTIPYIATVIALTVYSAREMRRKKMPQVDDEAEREAAGG